MAKKKSNKKSTYPNPPVATPADKKKQFRLGIGILLLLTGVFITLSIISYLFTWQADQDKILSNSLDTTVQANPQAIKNWGGALGAYISHSLVYRGVGMVSLLIGIWLAAWGLNLVYGKKLVPLLKYLRWFSVGILIIAPALAFLFPDTSFPYGGAFGDEAIHYLNNLIGTAGTGMLLIGIALFFLFGIFALDISPVLKKAKSKASNLKDSLLPNNNTASLEESNADKINHSIAPIKDIDDKEENHKEYELTITEKTSQTDKVNTDNDLEIRTPKHHSSENGDIEFEIPEAAANKEEFSFEVIQQQSEPVIKHGAHISIEDHEPYDPELDLPDYKYPTLDLLE